MNDALQPLRHTDRNPKEDPTGERLLDRSVRPYDVWVPRSLALVLGNSQLAERELNVTAVLRDGIPVHKRISGGGAVLLSPGCVCLALRFRKNKVLGIHDYFALGASAIVAVAKERFGVDLFLRGTSDLACATAEGERKAAGSALYMPRDFVLYLVSVLIRPDLGQIAEYLAHPSKEPDYRGGRGHGDFLTGLATVSGRDISAGECVPWFSAAIEGRLKDELDWELAELD